MRELRGNIFPPENFKIEMSCTEKIKKYSKNMHKKKANVGTFLTVFYVALIRHTKLRLTIFSPVQIDWFLVALYVKYHY